MVDLPRLPKDINELTYFILTIVKTAIDSNIFSLPEDQFMEVIKDSYLAKVKEADNE